MDFNEIKSGFLNYLSEIKKPNGEEYTPEELENISLFSNLEDFKKYLIKENIATTDIFTKSLSDIEQMQLVEGKLVEAEQTEQEESPEEDVEDDSKNIMTDLLNDLFSDDEVVTVLDSNESGDLDIDEICDFLVEACQLDDKGEPLVTLDSLAEPIQCIYLLDDIYNDEDTLKYLDSDNNGELSDEEKEYFETYLKGDNEELKLSDIQNAYDSMKDGTFPLDDYLKFKAKANSQTQNTNEPEAIETQSDTVASPSASNVGGGGVSGASGGGSYSPSSSSAVSKAETKPENFDPLEGKTVEELKTMRQEQETEVNKANLAKQAVYAGADPEVMLAQKDCDSAENAYKTALENDDSISDELKEQEFEILTNIKSKEQQIDSCNLQMAQLEQFITSQIAIINSDKSRLQSLNSSLAALPDTTGDDSDKAKGIEAKRAELASLITQAQAKLEADEAKLNAPNDEGLSAEEQLNKDKTDITKFNQELVDFNKTKKTLEKDIKDNCSTETLHALETFDEAKTNVEEIRAKRLKETQEVIDIEQAQLDKIDDKIKTQESQEIANEYRPTTIGEDIIEFAKQFDGKSASEMKQIMRSYGYQFDDGLWCADFVSFCQGMIIGEENLPDWYKNCNRAWTVALANTSKGKPEQITNYQDLQPGDEIIVGNGPNDPTHAVMFMGWADEGTLDENGNIVHNKYYTMERCGSHGYDGVGTLTRSVKSGEICSAFRLSS